MTIMVFYSEAYKLKISPCILYPELNLRKPQAFSSVLHEYQDHSTFVSMVLIKAALLPPNLRTAWVIVGGKHLRVRTDMVGAIEDSFLMKSMRI